MNDLYGAKAAIPENPATINLDPATGELTIPEVTPSIPPTPGYLDVTNSAPSRVKAAIAGWLVDISGDISKHIPSYLLTLYCYKDQIIS